MPWVRRRRANAGRVGDEADRLTRLYDERLAEQERTHPGYSTAWRRFASRLLQHGGTHVVPPASPDPMIDMLFSEGVIAEGTARSAGGEPSRCHENAVELWRSGAAVAIGTGYALSEDGLWREHSWGVDADGAIVETTVERVRYFGISMTGDRAEWFADWIERA